MIQTDTMVILECSDSSQKSHDEQPKPEGTWIEFEKIRQGKRIYRRVIDGSKIHDYGLMGFD